MKRHSFIVLCLHNLYPSAYAYMNMRITMVMLLRHTGHVSITATRFAQLSQKQGTSANSSRGATKHTAQVVSAAASVAVCGAVDVVVGVAAVDWLSSPSSSSLSLSAGCNAAVWAPMEWLTARKY